MNPWWLRPPAEEETPVADKPAKNAENAKSRKSEPTGRAGSRDRREPEQAKKALEPAPRPGRKRSSGRRRRSGAKGKAQMALFCDAESLALALRAADLEDLDMKRVVSRLGEQGRLVSKVAYGDWQRLSELEGEFRAAGIDRVGGPKPGMEGSYRPGVQLIADALELCYSPSAPDVFVLVSGEAGLLPLVEKLKAAGKRVVGFGLEHSLALTEREVYDDFVDLGERAPGETEASEEAVEEAVEIDAAKASLFSLLTGTIEALGKERDGVIWGSELKREMRRRRPDLAAGGFGYTTFSEFLEDADRHQVIHLERDDRSGSYYVAGDGRQ